MKNGDAIRSMTDEELATVFTDDLCELLCNSPHTCDSECELHMLTWLKQECKDDKNNGNLSCKDDKEET